ncbi:porin [Oxalobacteraceae bacterium]|nr:porin [Oxalobacteraceae bacterium]
MKKVAISILALGLTSTAAMAQSSVTVYGVADVGLNLSRGTGAGNLSSISSGIASGSRLGFKGKEDLGNGLVANFALESGISMDSGASGQGGLTFGRQSWVGLSGAFGAVAVGRQYSPYYKALRDVADPFCDGLAGTAANLFVGNTRVDNMAGYTSPVVGGFSADLAYGFGETAGDSAKNRTMGASGTYANGPLTVILAHHQKENALANAHTRNTMLLARYKFDILTAHVAHAQNRDIAGNASKDSLIGLTLPVGAAGRFIASAVLHNDSSAQDRDARQFGVGYVYSLSKRSDVYTAYSHINNRNGATFKVGNATESGTGTTGINLGLRHVF